MKRPNQKELKYYAGHIFLDQSFMNDIDKYISFKEEQIKEIKEFALNENPHGTEYDNGYNQALENLNDILSSKIK